MIEIVKIEVNVAYQGHITNCYLIYDELKQAVIIDPGYEADKILNKIDDLDLEIKAIVLTHSHADHIGALQRIEEVFHVPIVIHQEDLKPLLGEAEAYYELLQVEPQNVTESQIVCVHDGKILKVGKMEFEIIHTPGHTAGSICILEKNKQVLFTGDTIFSDCYGRCDLYSGDFKKMVSSLKKVFCRFSDIIIYPGHGVATNLKKAKRYIHMLSSMREINFEEESNESF